MVTVETQPVAQAKSILVAAVVEPVRLALILLVLAALALSSCATRCPMFKFLLRPASGLALLA